MNINVKNENNKLNGIESIKWENDLYIIQLTVYNVEGQQPL